MNWTARIKQSMASAMGLQLAGAPRGAVRVLPPGGGTLFVTEHEDATGQTMLQFAHAGGQSLLSLALNGKDSRVSFYKDATAGALAPAIEYVPGSETLALELYGQIKGSIVGREAVGGAAIVRRLGRLALWALAILAVIMMLAPSSSSKTTAAPATNPSTGAYGAIRPPPGPMSFAPPAAGSVDALPDRIPADARASAKEREAVAALQGVIKVGATGKPFYVFTDPNCPYCRQFEKTLESVPPGFQAVIVPLGYKEGSATTTAGVLCSANPAAEWKRAMTQGPSPTLKTCDRGERLMRENMALFESLRLNRTPTILTPANFLVSGAAGEQELAALLGAVP